MNRRYTTDKLHVNILADLCASYGMRKVVISPGSRNAPLVMAFHHHPDLECFVIPDERSAAYFAIGIAQYTAQPVGIICTSGTAALNYAPAMAEAFYQKLPLVAITADRPQEWIGQIDGQAINQTGIYSNFTSYHTQLPIEIFSGNEQWYVERIVRDGFLQLRNTGQPIHFNVPLREPLYNKSEHRTFGIKSSVFEPVKSAPVDDSDLMADLKKYTKVLLIMGMRRPDRYVAEVISQIAQKRHIVILQETLSNQKAAYSFQISDSLMFSILEKDVERLQPDLVITFGDILLSKPLKQWIRSLNKVVHWIVNQGNVIPDVFQRIDKVFCTDAGNFLQSLLKYDGDKENTYYGEWSQTYCHFYKLQAEYMKKPEWSDMHAFKVLSETIPGNAIIHLGNSSPVRYAQFFSWDDHIEFFGNRGTAGIDGVTSTAIGMASQTIKPVFLITGDVSFFYDSNAFWNSYKRRNFKVVVINNKGGNIFRLISGPQDTGLVDDYFTTHHPVSIESLCKAYGLDYFMAKNSQSLHSALATFIEASNCAVLEIETDPEVNTNVWKEYFRTIRMSLMQITTH